MCGKLTAALSLVLLISAGWYFASHPEFHFHNSDAHSKSHVKHWKPLFDAWMLDGTTLTAESLFSAWADAHDKQYSSTAERAERMAVFKASLDTIKAHNQDVSHSYKLGLNAYADMTNEEFAEHFGLVSSKDRKLEEDCSATKPTAGKLGAPGVALPQAIDWREKGGVGPVKNQGHCGSCWTFSTTGALEAHMLLKKRKFVSLSEQELVDCAQAYDNHGCEGGLPSHAFQYIIENGGLSTEKQYPYEAVDSRKGCRKHARLGGKPGVTLRSSFNITQFDETELQVAVGSVGPVSIAFEVVDDFRLYSSGVYSSKSCKNKPGDVNHAVLAVGYGEENGKKHWIVKNSWGADWGDRGYFKIARGENMCGVATCASFPILEG